MKVLSFALTQKRVAEHGAKRRHGEAQRQTEMLLAHAQQLRARWCDAPREATAGTLASWDAYTGSLRQRLVENRYAMARAAAKTVSTQSALETSIVKRRAVENLVAKRQHEARRAQLRRSERT